MRFTSLLLNLICLVFLLASCDDVSKHYSSRKDAELDQLFERGWLPSIIPLSSRDIITTNDLDNNTSVGQFSFDPADAGTFLRQLRRVDPNEIPTVMKYLVHEKGYAVYEFQSEWLFCVDEKAGHCEYRFILKR